MNKKINNQNFSFQVLLQDLKKQGLIKNIINDKVLEQFIDEKTSVYCGFDATNSTLHIGHLLQIKLLEILKNQGYKIIVLIGKSTARIGDPSFRSSERRGLILKEIDINYQNLKKQLKNLLPTAKIVNNNDWWKKMNVVDFFDQAGRIFTVNKMLERKGIKLALKNEFLTFSQFSYILLQAYDFFYLWEKYNCRIQVGGSDQMPNIAFGLSLIRKLKKEQNVGVGLITPLLVAKNGEKLSKTGDEKNIFLDEKITSIVNFYQFIINLSDEVAESWIKIFCNNYEKNLNKTKHWKKERGYQNYLAEYLISWVHTKNKWKKFSLVPKILNQKHLFKSDQCKLTKKDWEALKNNLPILPKWKQKTSFARFLVENNITSSISATERLIKQNGIEIRNEKENLQLTLEKQIKLSEEPMILIRKGKQNFYLIKN